MKRISLSELVQTFMAHNEEKKVTSQFEDENSLQGIICFENGPHFNREYPEESRSYRFSSDNKYFIPGMCGTSIFGTALDGSETIRLDWYLGRWPVEYCYIIEKN